MLSQTAEYALRAMAMLACHPEDLTPTPALAARTRVPANYLAKVLQLLAEAELIVGRRGVGGGYRLAREASEITLLEVVRAVMRVERIRACPLGLSHHGAELCPLHRKTDEVIATVIEAYGAMRLGDLVSRPDGTNPLCDAEGLTRLRVDPAIRRV